MATTKNTTKKKDTTPKTPKTPPTPTPEKITPAAPETDAAIPVITIAQIKEMKAAGDFAGLEKQIRSGAIELVPTKTLDQLILNGTLHRKDLLVLLQTIRSMVKGAKGLADNGHIIQRFVNFGADGTPNVNIMALMSELGPLAMGGKFENTAIGKLLTTSIDQEEFENIPLEALLEVVEKHKIDIKPYIELAESLGFKK